MQTKKKFKSIKGRINIFHRCVTEEQHSNVCVSDAQPSFFGQGGGIKREIFFFFFLDNTEKNGADIRAGSPNLEIGRRREYFLNG